MATTPWKHIRRYENYTVGIHPVKVTARILHEVRQTPSLKYNKQSSGLTCFRNGTHLPEVGLKKQTGGRTELGT